MNVEKWDILAKIQQGEGVDQTNEDSVKPVIDRWVLPWMPPDKYPRMLDIGCGFGYEAKRLAEHGYQVTAIDHADGNIKHAQEKYGLTILKMDMHDLQFLPSSFDCAVTRQVFEHSYAPWLLAAEVWVVLRSGGRWFIDLPSPKVKDMWTMWHPTLLYYTQMRFIFEKIGFNIVHAEEGAGLKLELNGGGEPYDYIVEKTLGYPDNFQHVLRKLEEAHQRLYQK